GPPRPRAEPHRGAGRRRVLPDGTRLRSGDRDGVRPPDRTPRGGGTRAHAGVRRPPAAGRHDRQRPLRELASMRRTLALVLGIALLQASPALAWDPFGDDLDAGFGDPVPDPAPFAVPEGLYVVTDVYAGDVVTTAGDTTTYATETVHDTPGTYARVIDVVSSGSSSAFDGASFNGRAVL